MKKRNIINLSDSYKQSHHIQYRKGTSNIYSYFESRGGPWNEQVFFGAQYFIKEFLCGKVVRSKTQILKGKERCRKHFAGNSSIFNEEGWKYIYDVHKGRLPVSIRCVPEGTVLSPFNALMTIEATDPKCYWLPNFLETILVQTWYPCTVATQSREMKKIIIKYLNKTGDPSLIPFKLHDFGFRGVSSVETAGIGGCAHLVNFLGTDTMIALDVAEDYYGCDNAGFSIPAAEHSTITSWGRENEAAAMENMLEQYPTGLVAVVSDSFNIFDACEHIWGEQLKDKIMNRNGTVVIRPDSGNPLEVLPKIFNILAEKFGWYVNEKGYYVLDPHVRVIQGDGIDFNSLKAILATITNYGWSTDNIAFGSGGGLLQKLNRDTMKFAFKCAETECNGVRTEVFKDPITDSGKRSKRGRMKVVMNNDNKLITVNSNDPRPDIMVEVFRNGNMLVEYTLDEIRKKAT